VLAVLDPSGVILSPTCKVGVATLVAALLVAAVSGCGSSRAVGSGAASSAASATVVRVGAAAIDRAEVEHWAGAIGRSNVVATALGRLDGTPRRKALQFLISANWLLGEAKERGLSISTAAIERGMREKIEALPGGRSEFDEELTSTGQTLADVRLEVQATLAAAALRSAVADRVPAVTQAQVASYYARHRRKFYLPNRRVVYLAEGIRSYERALALAREARAGGRLVNPWFRELVLEGPEAAERDKLAHMVFAATPGRVTGPEKFFGHWVLGIVKKLLPAGIQPLPAVRGELSKTLAVERRERALRRFAVEYARKWTARTRCSTGFVVLGCSQYPRVAAVEGSLLWRG
jgi:foldase protein PrsA